MTKQIDIRLIVEDGVDVEVVMHDIGHGMNSVLAAVPLVNDGFGHLMPDDLHRVDFTLVPPR